jgi:hypothetical protein
MKKNRFLTGFFTLFFTFVLSTCQFQPNFPKEPDRQSVGRDREFLAVLKARNHYTVSMEALESMVSGLLNQEGGSGRSVASSEKTVITGTKKLSVIGERRFPANAQGRSATGEGATQEAVDVYAFITKKPGNANPGYVLASNDIRIGNFLAVVEEGSLDDEELEWFTDIVYEGIARHIDRVIEEYDSITDEEAEQAATRFAARNVIEYSQGNSPTTGNITGGLYNNSMNGTYTILGAAWQWTGGYYATIPVQWHQYEPYSHVINMYKNNGRDYVAGCGPVAIAQLMARHKYPLKCTVSQSIPILNIKTYNYTYNWDKMIETPTNTNPDFEAIGVLMYEIGFRAFELVSGLSIDNWGTEETGVPNTGIINALRRMGYTTPNSFSAYNFTVVKNSVLNRNPVIISGYTAPHGFLGIPQGNGHYWLIDGVRNMIYYEYLWDLVNNREILFVNPGAAPGHIPDYTEWVHCNLGWKDNSKNAWYMSGIFDARTGHQAHARSVEKDDKYYRYELSILPHVYSPVSFAGRGP